MKLINTAAVRRMLLDLSRDTRAGKFTRVSQQTLLDANSALASWIRSRVQRTPSKGKTL